MKLIKKLKIKTIDYLGLYFLGIFSLFYILAVRTFAEIHIQFSFLDFPVFIGEILLLFCLILLVLKWISNRNQINLWHYLWLAYCLFFLIKAFWGYFIWGPLAFRHAALFYYPLFALAGYSFYRRRFFSQKKILFLSLLLIVIAGLISLFDLVSFNYNFILSFFLLALILIKSYRRRKVRYALFLLLLIFTPYNYFFHTSRTLLISNLVAVVYLLFMFYCVAKFKKKYKLIIFLIVVLTVTFGLLKASKHNAVKALLNFERLKTEYRNDIETINLR